MFIYLFIYFGCREWIYLQGLTHAKQALSYWAISPALNVFYCILIWPLLLGEGGHKESVKEVNMLEILYTHVWKRKNETCWNYSKKGGEGW
jgi:hypothetical protein